MGRMAKTAHPNSAWFLSQHCCEHTLWRSESFLTWASAFLASVTSHSSILLWCPDSRALLSTGPYLSWLQFIMTFWNHPNVAPPKDLVNNHLVIGTVFIVTCSCFVLSATKKYQIFRCLVHVLLDPCPFVQSSTELWLSWFMMVGLVRYPCALRKYHAHRIAGMLYAWPLFQPWLSWLC